MALTDPGHHQRSNNRQYGFPATHPMSYSSARQRQCTRVVLENDPSFGTWSKYNSLFNVTAIKIFPAIVPKIVSGFTVIRQRVEWLRPVRLDSP